MARLRYNGYSFNDKSHVKITETAIPDLGSRNVAYVALTVDVTAIVGGTQDTTDAEVATILQRLMEWGKSLQIQDRGAGNDLKIDSTNDVNFGPRTEVVNWHPIGVHAAEIRWRCVCHVTECAQNKHISKGVLARNWETNYSYDTCGDLVRSITGSVLIAQNWSKDGSKLRDNAEKYIKSIAAHRLAGFKRTHNWQVNSSKNTINFTFVDTQIPSPHPFPNTVIDASGGPRWPLFSLRGCNSLR